MKLSFSDLTSKCTPKYLALFLITTTWSHRLFESLWLDEALAYWTISGNFEDTCTRAFDYQGQSPLYYILLWLSKNIFGNSEFALRLPSLICTLLAIWFLYRLTRLVFSETIAWTSTIVFIASEAAIFSATTVRPYGLAILCTTASTYYLLEWLSNRRAHILAKYFFFTTASIYAAYTYSLIVLVHLAIVILGGKIRVSLRPLSFIYFLVLLCTAPLIPHLSYLMNRSELKLNGLASFSEVIQFWAPLAIVILLSLSFLYSRIISQVKLDSRAFFKEIFEQRNQWIVFWHLAPPLILFALSLVLSSRTLMQYRYLFWATPAFSIICGVAISHLTPNAARSSLLLFFTILVAIADPARPITNQNWRDAISSLKEHQSKKNTSVVYYSGLVETTDQDWLNDPSKFEYTVSMPRYYGFKGAIKLFHYNPTSSENSKYWDEIFSPLLSNKKNVFLLGTDTISFRGIPISQFILSKLKDQGVDLLSREDFDKVWLMEVKAAE